MSKIFLDYDQAALDAAYDQAVYASNRDQILARLAHTSELVRRRLGAPRRFAYGETPIEGLDVYRTAQANAPICVFVHGGAWRAGLARDYAFPAEMLVRAGAHYVALDFNNVLETNGDLLPMAEQVRRGIAWTFLNGTTFGGDESLLYVSGSTFGSQI